MKEGDYTVSGLIREAIRLYMLEVECRRLERYGRQHARGQDVGYDNVAGMVDEYRTEYSQDCTSGRNKKENT